VRVEVPHVALVVRVCGAQLLLQATRDSAAGDGRRAPSSPSAVVCDYEKPWNARARAWQPQAVVLKQGVGVAWRESSIVGQTNKKMKKRADASSGQCQGPQWQWGVIYSRPILAFVLAVTAPHRDRTCGTVEYTDRCWLCWLVPCTPETVHAWALFVEMEIADFSGDTAVFAAGRS
jgi:hypothetical protein